MGKRTSAHLGFAVLLCLVVFPTLGFAQTGNNELTGIVRDTSGAVLPGVTVEASSPALIEKVRSVVTDGEGRYRLIELRPGTYVLTFTLPGFNIYRREGLELTGAMTATVNADMVVGALEETLTVTGDAPLVDTQTTQQRQVLTSEVTESLPAINRTPAAYSVYIPAVVLAANNQAEPNRDIRRISVRGAPTGASVETLDGASYPDLDSETGGHQVYYFPNMGYVEEIVVDTSALGIENQHGGMTTNLIPRSGGNTYRFSFVAAYSDENMVQDNLTDDLRAQGLNSVNSLKDFWDYNASWGGPILSDKLTFWNSFRYWGNETYRANTFESLNFNDPNSWDYRPDLSKPFAQRATFESYSLRLTWQATAKNTFSAFYDNNPTCICDRANIPGSIETPEHLKPFTAEPNVLMQFSWRSPITNRLFVQALFQPFHSLVSSKAQPGLNPNQIGIRDFGTNVYYRAPINEAVNLRTLANQDNRSQLLRASANYVTGTHNVKVGFQHRHGTLEREYPPFANSLSYAFRNGVPFRVVQDAKPILQDDNIDADSAVYAADQWNIKRVMINAGVRWEILRSSVPAQSMPAGLYVGARSFEAIDDVPSWNDWAPRLAVAYDIFGDGKTALKATWGKYVSNAQLPFASTINPAFNTVPVVNRNWNDRFYGPGDPRTGNFVPDCDLTDRFKNGECEQVNNLNFGLNNPNATRVDSEILTGSGERDYSWQQTVMLDRELRQGIAVSVGYFRRADYNFRATVNTETTPDDFDHFCVTAPSDSRLPGGGGYQVCGLYDVDPAKFGKVLNFVTREDHYGKRDRVSDYIDVTTKMQLWQGMLLQGGISTGRVKLNSCFVVNTPQELLNCDIHPPFQASIKFIGVVPLPWAIQAAVAFQNVNGPEILAPYTASAGEVQGLGRPLAGGASTVTVPLIVPGTEYGDRVTTFDARFSKTFTFGKYKVNGNIDVYNLFNSSGAFDVNTTYGSNWLSPVVIQQSRYLKLTARLDF